ncbi:unnamed protein product [Moneuplotes crassus]|uniref:Uncharacterized protein n=1 Tax=Euplotes crassus TaxID=5936 RepID=A0AAD1X544_EUPCR|nr:unnamed protein product [Moneuplotes crassus]
MSDRRLKRKCYKGRTACFVAYACLSFQFNTPFEEGKTDKTETLEQLQELSNSKTNTKMNKNHKILTIFQKANTNDAGEIFLPQTSQIVLGDFRKKFCSKADAVIKDEETSYGHSYRFGSEKYYSYTEYLSAYMDRALKFFILHAFERYCEVCRYVTGGFVDRIPNYKTNTYFYMHKSELYEYQTSSYKIALYKCKELKEQNYELIVTPGQLEFIKAYLKEKMDDFIINKGCFEVQELKAMLDELENQDEYSNLKSYDQLDQVDLLEGEVSHEAKILFEKLLDVNFPDHLLYLYSRKMQISEEESFIIFIEYLKFLILKYLNPEADIVPSFRIDQFWRDHFVLTKNYRDISLNIFESENIVLYSQTTSSDFPQNYEKILDLYQETFGCAPHGYVWGSATDEQSFYDQDFLYVNTLRLAVYTVYEANATGVFGEGSVVAKECWDLPLSTFHSSPSKATILHVPSAALLDRHARYRTEPSPWKDLYEPCECPPQVFCKGSPKFLDLPVIDGKEGAVIDVGSKICYPLKCHLKAKKYAPDQPVVDVEMQLDLDDLANDACEGVHLLKDNGLRSKDMDRAMGYLRSGRDSIHDIKDEYVWKYGKQIFKKYM